MKPTAPICPKCGYDQSGEVLTWEKQCPMEGRCPECGQAFAWFEAMEPRRFNLDWNIEHARTIQQMFRRTWSTIWMLLIPNRYWKRVGVETPMRTGWLFLWLFLVLLAIHLLTSLVVMGYDIEDMRSIWGFSPLRDPQEWVGLTLDGLLWPINTPSWWAPNYFQGSSAYQSIYGFDSWYELKYPLDFGVTGTVRSLTLMGASVIWMVLLLALAKTRRIHGVRIVHVFRAFALTVFAASLLFELGRFLEPGIEIVYMMRGSFWGDFFRYDADVMIFGVPSIILLIWVQWFWAAAIGTGWKIRSGWMLSMAGICASLLGGFLTYLVVVYY